MINLLDLMTEDDKAAIKEWAKERMSPKYKQDIPIPYYLAAELGYYYGWQAVVDGLRGYHIGIDSKGNKTRIAFGLEQASALIEAAKKVKWVRSKKDEIKETDHRVF